MLGRSMHLFMQTLINPGKCQLQDIDSEMETLIDKNEVTVKLFDNYGEPHYVDPKLTFEELR